MLDKCDIWEIYIINFFLKEFLVPEKSVPETKKTGFLTKGDFEMSIAKKHLMTG